jgi:hypothetical protein
MIRRARWAPSPAGLMTRLGRDLFQDLRYGARTLRRNPRFTLVSILALALGIGVNTVVFTAYKAFIARPIDARNPSTLVNIALRLQSGETMALFSYLDFEGTTFVVSENYFAVLGVAPIRGRAFDAMTAAELAASPAVLISENYWNDRFAGDPDIVGKISRHRRSSNRSLLRNRPLGDCR